MLVLNGCTEPGILEVGARLILASSRQKNKSTTPHILGVAHSCKVPSGYLGVGHTFLEEGAAQSDEDTERRSGTVRAKKQTMWQHLLVKVLPHPGPRVSKSKAEQAANGI